MVTLNPIDVFLWTVRRNENDVVNLYNSLSGVMQLATGGTMLNFGYWEGRMEPVHAQENLCHKFGSMAELNDARTAVDLGSGLSAPAILWQKEFTNLCLYCVNTNYGQLLFSGRQRNIEFLNSTSTMLPLSDGTVDRVLALESSQHFKPYMDFVSESRRVLKPSGILALALPVTLVRPSLSNLGMLKLTWSSEHYTLGKIRDLLKSGGFQISEERLIGSMVYEPLADFYIENRQNLRDTILARYPAYVEKILFWSIQKMKKASENKMIDYVLFKCLPS